MAKHKILNSIIMPIGKGKHNDRIKQLNNINSPMLINKADNPLTIKKIM
jgi:hypothetical protein